MLNHIGNIYSGHPDYSKSGEGTGCSMKLEPPLNSLSIKSFTISITEKFLASLHDMTTNLETLKNLEPSFGVILEIKTIQNYLHGHTVSTVRFIWLIYWNKFGKKECELEVLILTNPKKCKILQKKITIQN